MKNHDFYEKVMKNHDFYVKIMKNHDFYEKSMIICHKLLHNTLFFHISCSKSD